MNTTIETYDDTIIRGLQAPQTEEAARTFLQLCFSDEQKDRMSELAARARSGEITPTERVEADGYERVSSLLGILQSMARMTLKQGTA